MARNSRDQEAARRISWFLGLAVLVHLALGPLLTFFVPEAPPRTRTKALRVVQLPSLAKPKKDDRPKAKPIEREQAKKKEKKKEEEKKAEKLDGQVVELPPSLDDRPPEESDYLSENNTRTDKETKSRHSTSEYQNAMNELSKANAEKAASPNRPQKASSLEIGPDRPSPEENKKIDGQERAFEMPTIQQRDRLALKLDPDLGVVANQAHTDPIKGNSHRLKLALGKEPTEPKSAGTAPSDGQPAIELMPSIGVLARLSGAPANDHLPDLEEGEGTFLNSREFKYASFFNRIKRGVSQQWEPLGEYRRRDPSGNIYGNQSRMTVLKVSLTREGNIRDIQVTRSSGVDFLDHEAMAAFRRAEPFPNPPSGLADDKGAIDFPFGFHIDFSRRGGIRLPF